MAGFFLTLAASWMLFWPHLLLANSKSKYASTDVFVFEAGPTGVAAAITASRSGLSVLICHPYKKPDYSLLSANHFREKVVRTGIYQEIRDSVNKKISRRKHFSDRQPDSLQLQKLYENVISELLKRHQIEIKWQAIPESVWEEKSGRGVASLYIRVAKSGSSKNKEVVKVAYAIDASQEGQLMALFPCRYYLAQENPFEELMKDKWQVLRSDEAKQKNRARLLGLHWLQCHDGLDGENLESIQHVNHSIGVGFLPGGKGQTVCFPFGMMVPTQKVRLFCPGPVSVSEGCFNVVDHPANQVVLGQAAGAAVVIAIKKRLFPHQIAFSQVQQSLLKQGVELVYFNSFIAPADSLFYPIQRLGLMQAIPFEFSDWDGPILPEDLNWVAERTGFSPKELQDTTKGKSKRESVILIFKMIENLEKGP